MKRLGLFGCALVLSVCAAMASAQTTLLPPACAGKTGAQLDLCVRDVTLPMGPEILELTEQKADPRQFLNCQWVNRADEGFCIAHNEIILECRTPAKHPDFDACANRLITRPQPPRAADCTRLPPAQRNQCTLRNKVFNECLSDPWRYFICLGEKMNAR